MRELRTMLRIATDAPPTPDLLDRVLARREEGERIILPDVAPVPRDRAQWWTRVAAAAVLLLCAIGLAILTSPRAEAVGSDLHFFPERPGVGAAVRVSYEPGGLFAGLDTVVLRARMRSANDQAYNRGPRQHPVATLVRMRDGSFYGSIRLPDSVVYAVFAVEDPTGEVVDHNRNRLWELEVHDAQGKPLFASLRQRFNDLFDRNFDELLPTAKRMTELYPDHPESWNVFEYMQFQTSEPARHDSIRAAHRARFDAFHARLSATPGLQREVVRSMEQYAVDKDRRSERAFWRERLEREYPADWNAAFTRQDVAFRAAEEVRDWSGYLEEMEKIWRQVLPVLEPGHDILFNNALVIAKRAHDPEAFYRWVERTLRYGRPGEQAVVSLADRMEPYPELRPRLIAMLRRYLAAWSTHPDDATRPLTMARAEHRRDVARASSIAWALLGNALVGEGDLAAGRAALDRAANTGWEARAFMIAARGRLDLGDTLGALHEYARLAADPGFETYADSARARGGRLYDPAAWERWRAEAAERMRRETLADAANRPLRRARVADGRGGFHDLRDLTAGRVTIVAYWSPWSPHALRELEALHRWAAAREVGLVALTNRTPGPELNASLREVGATFSTYYDPRSEARDVLRQTAYPEYWVVDGEGHIVFEDTPLPSVRRQVMALLGARASSD